jgi:hypothetical protein
MNRLICHAAVLAVALTADFIFSARAQSLDQIGVTLLRTQTTNLDGSGIRVAQPEANTDGNTNDPSAFEVNPASANFPASRFAYFSATGTTNVFPNLIGNESGHADSVGNIFYGLPGGVATNVVHVDNLDADYFFNYYVVSNLAVLGDSVVNQSFIFTETNGSHASISEQRDIDSTYDDYAAQHGTFFISGAGNGGPVNPSATCYNGLGVGVFGGSSSYGPTIDNGRCKPDLIAPGGPPGNATSFSTPHVAGAAALLMQAALRGDGGSDTNSAFDMRTIKALLLNGAVKPADWTNANSSPLDARYGAGVLNVFNSYKQLAGGKNNSSATNLISIGAAHSPVAGTNFIAATSGWDFENISSTATNDAVNHYFFNATNGFVTATLVWNRQLGETNINDLDLFLFNAANGNLVACSTSRVDNVEHIFVPQLPAGIYDLQVLKNGSTNVVSDSETYALAFAFAPTKLNLMRAGTNAVLTWPVYPAGFCVEAATNLSAPAWSTNNPSAALTGSMNILTLSMTNALQFFRLRSPNF